MKNTEQKDMIIIRKGDTSFSVTNKDSISEYVYVEGLEDMNNFDFSLITSSNLPSGWRMSNEGDLIYELTPLPEPNHCDYYHAIEKRGQIIIRAAQTLLKGNVNGDDME